MFARGWNDRRRDAARETRSTAGTHSDDGGTAMRVSCKISRVCKISKVLYLQNGPGRSSGLSLGLDHQNAPPLCSSEPTTHGPRKTQNLAAMLQWLLNCLSLAFVAAAARSSERRCLAGRHARHFNGPVPPLKGVCVGFTS